MLEIHTNSILETVYSSWTVLAEIGICVAVVHCVITKQTRTAIVLMLILVCIEVYRTGPINIS